MLTQKIYAHARQFGDKSAVVFNGREISYHEFASLIEAARRTLMAEGATGRGVAVLPNGSLLNVWIVGLALRSLGLTTVVAPSVEEAGRLGLPEIRCIVAVGEERWAGLDRLCADRRWQMIRVPEPKLSGAWQPAALETTDWPVVPGERILLTSGTTGAYKKSLFDPIGDAAKPHRHQVYGISESSVVNVLMFGGWTAIGYNVPANTWDAGGTVLIQQGSHLGTTFRHPGITHAFLTPHLLQGFLQAPHDERTRNDKMRLIVTAGALSQGQFEAARARLTTQIYTSIGATEAGVMTLTHVEQPDDLRWHRVVPECEVEIVDDEGQVLPIEEVGQIRVRVTDGATGYLHDEAATRAFFHDGYFYPGDLGVFRSDGRLALHGRVTDVINVLGNKFAAAPIEERLVDKCGVAAACVLSSRRADGEEILHVVLESLRPIPGSKLAAVLAKTMPGSFSVQAHYVEALPRNYMGKVRRDVLRRQLGLV